MTVFGLLLACISLAAAQQPAFWGTLKKGPHTVGFECRWASDPSRTYRLPGSEPDPAEPARPILLNIWYPAAEPKGRPMQHREYFDIESRQPEFRAISKGLREYALEVAATEILGKAADKRTLEDKAALDKVLDTATASYRGAKPASGRFPLVIYHAGYGSSFEDNAALCEYLASWGYVVVGSAFQKLDGSSFNIEGAEGTGQDLLFIIRYAQGMANVDWDHIGYVGHSGGAQAGLVFQSHGGTRVDAMVSLDTTQDYYSLADWRWKYMTDPVMRSLGSMRQPILFCAAPEAGFDMADRMRFTPRYYFTVDELNHNDYISQGTMTRIARALLKPDDLKLKQTRDAIQDRYSKLCEVVRGFLGKHLKGDVGLLDALMRRYDRPVRIDSQSLSYAPIGQAGPVPYDAGKGMPPGPRDIRPLIAKIGAADTGKLIESFKEERAAAPVYDLRFAFALLFQMVSDGKSEDAKTIFAAYVRSGVDVEKAILDQAEFAKVVKMPDFEEKCYRTLLAVDPGNEKAAEGLKAMGKSAGLG